MKRLIVPVFTIIVVFLMLLLPSFSITSYASDNQDNSNYDAVYFGSNFCSVCLELEEDGVIQLLKDQGYNVKTYYLDEDSDNVELLRDYQDTYDVPLENYGVPVLFAGSSYFIGRSQINNVILDGSVQLIMDNEQLLTIHSALPSDFSLIYFILLGVVDGVNPCAIAMLLMFISLLSFTTKKQVLLKVSFSFISAIFISYFLFGTVLYSVLSEFSSGSILVKSVPWIIIGISGIFFLLNFYDFIMSTLQKYDKIKNQLPKGIQKFNRKLMASFTQKLDEGSPTLYIITFFIGLIISFTEFLCTGQAYFTAILHLIHFTNFIGRGIILLLFYNLIFVLPLILISFISIKTQSITSVAAFMRERLSLIKLFNSIVFFAIFLYYILFMI